jgi:hypothetical protein
MKIPSPSSAARKVAIPPEPLLQFFLPSGATTVNYAVEPLLYGARKDHFTLHS